MSIGRTLRPLAEVGEWLRARLPDCPETEAVATTSAAGRVVAEPTTSGGALPATTIAAEDGYALVAEATVGVSLYTPLRLSLVGPDADARAIAVGEPLPPPRDAVLPAHQGHRDGDHLQVSTPLAPGEGTVPAGAEIPPATLLAAAGHRLSALDGARLAACWMKTVTVYARPVVALLRRGSHRGPDITGPLLTSELERWGVRPRFVSTPTELEGVALVLLYGGSGWSPADDAATLLRQDGDCHWHGTAIRPGTSLLGGMLGEVPALGLPGAPWPAFAAFRLAVAPALEALSGVRGPVSTGTLPLTGKITSAPGLTEYVPVAIGEDGIRPLRRGGLLPPAGVDGMVRVADGSEGFPRGAAVAVEGM
ncbi:hypothetical protein [Arhodomonas sp. SL1]|uniref:hypothetical protein n=1 Tax=Arhodomonas sp. SL1 TaxID=3425691 RepID=UPI003F884CE4